MQVSLKLCRLFKKQCEGWDMIFLYLCSRRLLFMRINKYWSLVLPRKRDQPPVIHLERSAAVISWWLLQIYRLSDHAALQQGSGVDHLLQACVSVPLTGALSSDTHTLYSQCTVGSHLHSQWITCCPTNNFSPHVPLLSPFPSFLSTHLHIKTKLPKYSRLLSRAIKPVTGFMHVHHGAPHCHAHTSVMLVVICHS